MPVQAPVKNEFTECEDIVSSLLPKRVRVSVVDPCAPRSAVYPEEAACLPPMRALRRREFLAGREALRSAMLKLGHQPCAIPMRGDRSPELPDAIRASLTHTARLCIATADLGERTAGLGVDAELREGLDPGLWPTVCTRTEKKWLKSQPDAEQPILAKQIFCAKEAAYKCQYALSGTLLDFDAFDVTFHSGNRFHATFRQSVGPFAMNDRICGRFGVCEDHIVAAAHIPA